MTTNSIPLYALYSGNPTSTQCPKGTMGEGVFIAGGNAIYSKFKIPIPRSISDSDLLDMSNPLSCLLCCPISSDHIDYFLHYYPEDSTSPPGQSIPNDPIRGIHKRLPNYVISFLENCKNEVPDWWEGEFERDISELNALLVTDLRGEIHA